ncbi:MAG: Smr/MutS family protein [Bacteroidota bacterium]
MIYPENFETKIGFHKVRELLEQQCLSPLGQKHVEQICFETSHGTVQQLLSQAEEFRQVLLSGISFPNSGYYDLSTELKRIQLKGTYLDLELLFDLKTSLQTINSCLAFFMEAEEGIYPELTRLTEGMEPQEALVSEIERIVDDKGMVRDNASIALKEIRSKLHRKQKSIDGRISKSMQEARKAGLTPDDAEVTIRNGRMVIPVLAAGKRQLKGFIHDESATGQTVFIEPTEVFDLNNEIRELENAERREIIHILINFTDKLRPQSDILFYAYDFLGKIDFIRAKAKLALMVNGIKPLLKPTPLFNWRNARHPLLYLSLKEQDKGVVPMDLELHKKHRILVISGPNAGGKSVCLKTTGLLQYMLQCGLLAPMEENSEAGIFKDIFLDIGDEQSLENDLSTYSSHLINIREFINKGNRNTLFLIDEFGTGTEPHLGGAIAEASLHAMNAKKAYGVVTTHYANIKLMADNEAGILNGAMLFDTHEMRPLYMLHTGKPGSSFAFEIARKIGFPEDVLEQAASITGYSQIDFEKQLQELETEKMQLEKEKQKYGVADDFLAETIDKYEKLISELNEKKSDIIDEARREAGEILSGANRMIEHTIKEIREAEAEKEKTKDLRKKLKVKGKKILENNEQGAGNREQEVKNRGNGTGDKTKNKGTKNTRIKKEPVKYLVGIPVAGDMVEIVKYGTIGEVVEVKGQKAKVLSGSVSIEVKLDDIKKIAGNRMPDAGSRKKSTYRNIMSDINKRAAKFSPSIDLRGKRAIEALDELKFYLDDAILLSVKEVTILHGKGDGILRNVLREYLQTVDDVEHFGDAHVERGGQGITIVRLS